MNLEDIQKDKYYLYTPPYGKPARRVRCTYREEKEVYMIVDDPNHDSETNGWRMTFNRLEAERYLHQIAAP